MNLEFSEHSLMRVRQRGVNEADVAAIMSIGTLVSDDSVLLLEQDVDREIREYKYKIATLERLRGCRVVIAGSKVVTVYRPTRKKEKYLLRKMGRA